MNNKDKGLDIYLMGIGGTGMGALAGLLKTQGHRVRGSDSAVYSPMKEKLAEWKIPYKTPYAPENLQEKPDLIIVGNVIRRDNPEAQLMRDRDLSHDSFPSALRRLYLSDAKSLVACGTHGKTTCGALMAHTLSHAGLDPGFLIGGIPLNFGESFRASSLSTYPFVVEGDEYDTAYFDKQPKFMHYDPNFLLITSIEFDHGDIYRDLDAVIDAFARLMANRSPSDEMVLNCHDHNIRIALERSGSKARVVTYGEGGDYRAKNITFDERGISFSVSIENQEQGSLNIPLFGHHNFANALGCYGMLHRYGLSHHQIAQGFSTFLGVKRRLEERSMKNDIIKIDDFAHHPTAVRETIRAARQKYPGKKLMTIFEPRSATSCSKIFEEAYVDAFLGADYVALAPVGRMLAGDQKLDTLKIVRQLKMQNVRSEAHDSYESLKACVQKADPGTVLLFMSNGDFGGNLNHFLA